MIRSGIFLSALTLLASVLGFLVQLLVARQFGAGRAVDAYLAAMSAPLFVSGAIAAWFSYSVVPEVVRLEPGSREQRALIEALQKAAMALALAVGAVGWIMSSSVGSMVGLVHASADGTLERIAWGIAAVQVLAAMYGSILNGLRHFVPAALLALLPYVGMLVGLVAMPEVGIIAQAYGLLLGTAAVLAASALRVRKAVTGSARSAVVSASLLRGIFQSAPFAAAALSCFSIYSVVDAYWAQRAGEAALSHLGYAQRIIGAAGSIVVAGPSAFLIPRLSAAIRDRDAATFQGLARKVIVTMAVASGLAAVMVLPFLERMVGLLFVRGAFKADDARELALCIWAMSPGAIAMLMSVIIMRAIFCIPGGARKAVRISALWALIYTACSAFLYKFGAPAIGLGYSVTWVVSAAYAWRVLRRLTSEACRVA